MSELNKESANLLISEKLKGVAETIDECVKIANQFGLSFDSPLDGHYGMGGTFYGQGCEDAPRDFQGAWYTSTDSCM